MAAARTGRFPSSVSQLSSSVSSYLSSYVRTGGDETPKSAGMVFGFFAGKLSDAYRDANRKIQGTREILQSVQVQDVTGVVSDYVSRLTRELPVLPKIKSVAPRGRDIPEDGRKQADSRSSPETPVLPKLKSTFAPRERDIAEDSEDEKTETNSPKDPDVLQEFTAEETPGSVHCSDGEEPRVFLQKLVDFPTPLSELTSLPNAELFSKLPEPRLGRVLSVFFVAVADHRERLSPTPAVVLVCEDGLAVQGETQAELLWSQFTAAEVGLGGQSVKMIGNEEEDVLTLFTHSAKLTQEFCRDIVNAQNQREPSELQSGDAEVRLQGEALEEEGKVCARGFQESSTKEGKDRQHCERNKEQVLENEAEFDARNVPESSSKKGKGKENGVESRQSCDVNKEQVLESNREKEKEGNQDIQSFSKNVPKSEAPVPESEPHPLLSADLMPLSLDWTSRVPDLFLLNGFRVQSRFKRVLADLLYLVHGNMEGPGRPSLAHVRALVYTSVRVESGTGREVTRFLLTDTHVCSVREDSLRSLSRGESGFCGLRVRGREQIRCVFVRSEGGCVELELVFHLRKHLETRRRSVDLSALKESSPTWSLRFGDSSDAAAVLRHLVKKEKILFRP